MARLSTAERERMITLVLDLEEVGPLDRYEAGLIVDALAEELCGPF